VTWNKHVASIYHQKRYKKRIRLGLCVVCARRKTNGKKCCDDCLRKRKEWRRVRTPLFCAECRKEIKGEERDGRRLHRECSLKRSERRNPQQHRSAAMGYQQRHKNLGLCLSCSRKVFKWSRCRQHYAIAKERYDRVISYMKAGQLGGNNRNSRYRKHTSP